MCKDDMASVSPTTSAPAAEGTAARDMFINAVQNFVNALLCKFKNNPEASERIATAARRFRMFVVDVSDKMKDAVAKTFVRRFHEEMSPLYSRIARADETFVQAIRNEMFHDMQFDKLFEQSSLKTKAVMVRHVQAICTCAQRYLALCQTTGDAT